MGPLQVRCSGQPTKDYRAHQCPGQLFVRALDHRNQGLFWRALQGLLWGFGGQHGSTWGRLILDTPAFPTAFCSPPRLAKSQLSPQLQREILCLAGGPLAPCWWMAGQALERGLVRWTAQWSHPGLLFKVLRTPARPGRWIETEPGFGQSGLY